MSTLFQSDKPDKCPGNIVSFDVQSAEPGTFTVPGVIDLETFEPGSLAEISWIYFKGDPQAGPQPGRSFKRPFNSSVKFSIDLVRDDDISKVLYEIMRESPRPLHRIMYTDRTEPQRRPIPAHFGKAVAVRSTEQLFHVHPSTRQLVQILLHQPDDLPLGGSKGLGH